jgi:DNA helicase-2/ATP-dependent DNA helicase PcrA
MPFSESTDLNEEQKQAVDYNEGPLLIIAGAGTGKTTVIVEKVKQLIAQNLAKPEEILALTFTEKAASEMEERVDKALPYGYFQMWISTFHSFADEILHSEISHIGLNPGYKLITEAEAIVFIRKNLFKFDLKYFRPLGNPEKFIAALLQHFSRLRDENITPEEYVLWAKSPEHEKKLQETTDLASETELKEEIERNIELAHAYKTYSDLKIEAGYMDFSDLISYLLLLFQKRPSLLKKYQQQFKYVLVDEFQDTNIAQYLLIKLLCPPSANPHLTAVGDDSQAIYKFRGASISNILNFMKDYPTAKQITLNKNYRSYQDILDASHKLIQNNNPDTLESQLGISKKLIAHLGKKKECISFHLAENGETEADHVVKEILSLKAKHNYKFSDFALLVRANTHADPFITTFARNGVPYRFLGPGTLFKQAEIKDLIAYLNILYNIEDSVSLYRVLSMDIFNIDQKDLTLLMAFAKKTNLCFFQAIYVFLSFYEHSWFQPEFEVYRRHLPLVLEMTKPQLVPIIQMIQRHMKLLHKESAAQIVYYFLEDTNYLQKLVAYKTEKDEKIALNITKFFNKLKAFEYTNEDASVMAVVEWIKMSMEMGESPLVDDLDAAAYDAVNVLTIHAAKGLEFPVVFMVNLSTGRFPTYEKKEPLPIPAELVKEILPSGNYHLQEERRLFYVAITRAKERLYLSSALTYGEGKRERKVSPFVIETLGEDEVKKMHILKNEEKSQLSLFDFKKTEMPVIKQELTLSNFSYTQLESFKTCGLQYKYQYILKVPTQPNAAASFGDTIHRTLQQFYQDYMADRSVGVERMLEIFHQGWTPLGYTSQAHEQKMKKEGEEMIKKFYETLHSGQISVMGLEKLFKIRVSRDIFLTGKIDRVDHQPDGGIEIIDYKTGKKPDEKELKKSLQLSIYALAAMDKGLYHQELEKVTLTFYYLQDMSKISMQRTPEDIAKVKEEVEKTVSEIRKNDFQPKVGPWCNYCAFKMICEAWQ